MTTIDSEDRMKKTFCRLAAFGIGAVVQGSLIGFALAQGTPPSLNAGGPAPQYGAAEAVQMVEPAAPSETTPSTELPVLFVTTPLHAAAGMPLEQQADALFMRRYGFDHASTAAKTDARSVPYEQIPYAPRTGNLFGLNREFIRAEQGIGKSDQGLESLVREPGLSDVKAQPPAHARIIVCRQLYAGVRPGYIL